MEELSVYRLFFSGSFRLVTLGRLRRLESLLEQLRISAQHLADLLCRVFTDTNENARLEGL